jgi:hypothetical protein
VYMEMSDRQLAMAGGYIFGDNARIRGQQPVPNAVQSRKREAFLSIEIKILEFRLFG